MLIIATMMLTVPTPRDHFTAHVTMVTQEMVSFVSVKKHLFITSLDLVKFSNVNKLTFLPC